MLRYLYSALFYLLMPLVLLRLLWRSRKMPEYRRRWAERFAYFNFPKKSQHGLWIHTVSLGEIIAAIPMIKMLMQQYPELPLTLTSMTITGSNRIQKEFGDSVTHVYVPYDVPSVVKRFLTKVQPKMVIILETELWPNILYYCRQRQIPVMLANARLSERSAKGYQRLASITKEMLQSVTVLAAHAKADAERFIALGLPAERAHVVGSIKFDVDNSESIYQQAAVLRQQFGTRPVWMAASTHEGEEAKILQTFKQVRNALPTALLVLVPRHPERFAAVKALCQQQGFSVVTRSSGDICTDSTQVFLGDTMGELKTLYAAAAVAFVGGSLAPIGGHNVLEPISLGIPTMVGPHMHNFAEITAMLLQADALVQIQDTAQLAPAVQQLLTDAAQREQLKLNGNQVMTANRGALQKNLALIAQQLKFR